MTNEDQHVMLMIKSLLNHMRYVIKEDDIHHVDEFHTLCRKYCSWGDNKATHKD